MKQRLAKPDGHRRPLRASPSSRGIDKKGNALVIGAMTTHAEVATSSVVRGAIAGLVRRGRRHRRPARAQPRHHRRLGRQQRSRPPTIPAALLALGATIATNKREITADDFFKGLFTTALGDGEIITRISFPMPGKFAYVKFANPASRYALVGVAVAQTGSGRARRRDGRRQQRRLPPQGDGGGARPRAGRRSRWPASPPTPPT